EDALPEEPVVTPEHTCTLRTLGPVATFLASSAAQPPAPCLPAALPISAAGADAGKVQQALLAVVADKTGYPPEMLKLEMDMESDQGIDSIKRVEILSAVQDALPEAPVVKPEHMGTLRTLGQVAAFLTGP